MSADGCNQGDENDPLLDSIHQGQYGGLEAEDLSQPDEEELRREREELDRITAEATEYGRVCVLETTDTDDFRLMIDVSHPSMTEHCQQYLPTNHDRYSSAELKSNGSPDGAEGTEDAEEAEWLQSLRSSGLDSVSEVKGLQSGALIMDIGQLRLETPTSSAKRALKSALR